MKFPVTLDNTIGAAFLGVTVSCVLFGIAVVQTHLYYYNFSKDWMLQKISVGVLMTLATLHMVFTVHAMYSYLIVNFGNPAGLETIVWSFKLQVLFNTLMVFLVQGLYAMRVWKLGKHISRLLPALVGFVVACGWGIGLLLIVKAYEETSFADLRAMSPFIYMAFTSATTIDMVIAFAMCYYLNWSRSPFIGTNNKIVMVMRYVLITGFLTSAGSLSTLITYAIMPDNMVFIGIDFMLPNIYINSYFALLNARTSINEQQPPSVDVSKMLNIKTGSTNLTDSGHDGHKHFVDDKMSPDSIPPSATRLTYNFSSRYDPEQATSSQDLGVITHRTEDI